VTIFSFLTSFGIDNIASREIIKDHNKKDTIIGTGFYLKIVGSLLAIITVFVISIATTRDMFTLGLIWVFSLSFIPQAFNIIEVYFQSQILSKKVVSAQIISNVISTILKILCIILTKGIFWLVVIHVIESIIYGTILLFSFKRFGTQIKEWKFDINIAKSLLKDSWPLMLSSVAIGIYMKIDQVMIKNILGNEPAGIYAVAVRLSEAWYFIPMLICTSLSPAIIRAKSISKELLENRMKRLYFIMFWLSLIIAFLTTVFAYLIIKTLFGNPYLGAITTLQIYVWAGIGVSLGIAVGQYLLVNNLTKISFYCTSLGAGMNVILNIILIPILGINGAAIATLFSYMIATFSVLFFKQSSGQGLLIIKSIIAYK
jgi:O-antigen/teichoic acid export membrane protein